MAVVTDGPSRDRLVAVVAAVVVATAVTVAGGMIRPVSRRHRRQPRAATRAEGFAPDPVGNDAAVAARILAGAGSRQGPTSDDWDALCIICCAISGARLDWMRSYAFVTPWLDTRVRAVLELEPLVAALRERPFSAELRTRLGDFSNALTAFATYYTDNTFPDPLLTETDWHFFDWSEVADAEPGLTSGDHWKGPAAHMQSLSVALSNAYLQLQTIATSDPRIRDRAQDAAPRYR